VEVLQGAPLHSCWPRKGADKLATPLGNEDLAIMTNLSDLSIKFCEEYTRERCLADKRLFLSCFRKMEQGVIWIMEWQPPSTIDTLKEMQSSGNLSDELSEFVNYYIKSLSDKEDSSESILVNLESVVEKPTNDIVNSCKALPSCDVVGQETSRPSLAEIVDLKSPNKSIEATNSTSTLGGGATKQRHRCRLRCDRSDRCSDRSDRCPNWSNWGQPGLTTSPRLLHNKSKPKMVKPKNLRLVFGKKLNLKAVIGIKEKSRSLMRNFRLSLKGKIMSMVLVGLKILNAQNLLLKRSSIMRIGNGVTLTNQCHFLHMDHQCLCHGKLILICIIFVLHGIIIHICHLLLVPFVLIVLIIESR
jgi:hypothetical protein